VLARDGLIIGRFATREALRSGAAAEIAALRAAGYGVHLLSGDALPRVAALAAALGIPADQALGGRTPEDKAADLARIGGADALYLGDGANDALAFGQALCAGTVAIERPILPGRSDFFIVGAHLAPLRAALEAARRLRRVARRILALAVAYNVLAVSTALAGLMSPVRAAIFMPLSSLSILLFTVMSLRPKAATAASRPLVLEAAR
jgi:Cu2+-exporting ATPase